MNNNNQISAAEAQIALESLESTKRNSIKSFRPPLWLNILMSFSLGVESFSAPLSSGNSLWTFVMLVSTGVMLFGMATWFIMLRLSGVKPKIVPLSVKNRVFITLQGILIAFVILASIEFYKMGFTWIPYVAGPVNAVIGSYLLHNFPTGEWK